MNNLKSLFTVFLLLAIGEVEVHGQEKVPGIIVELSNGEKLEYVLTDNPKFVYDGQTITLTAEGVHIEYLPSDLAKITTGEVASNSSDIQALPTQQGDIKVYAGFVRLSGFAAGEAVHIYSVSGSLLATLYIQPDGSLVIPVSTLPPGISIIKTNQQSIKITKQ